MKPPASLTEEFKGSCAVCELPIADTRTVLSGSHEEKSYVFCSQKCMKEFYSDPEAYLSYEEDEEETE